MPRGLFRIESTIQLNGAISPFPALSVFSIKLIQCRLPKDMPLDYGALLEPLAVAIHAIRRSQMAYSSRVLIFGAGAVGLLCAAMAKISGAGKVVIADIDSGRTDFAVKHRFADLGFAVNSKRGSNTEEDLEIATGNAQSISKSADVEEFDLSFECTGVPSCLQAAIYVRQPTRINFNTR